MTSLAEVIVWDTGTAEQEEFRVSAWIITRMSASQKKKKNWWKS